MCHIYFMFWFTRTVEGLTTLSGTKVERPQAGPKGEVQEVPNSPARGAPNKYSMVTVAQLVEPWVVIPVVVGSSPISHPIFHRYICRAVSSAGRAGDS